MAKSLKTELWRVKIKYIYIYYILAYWIPTLDIFINIIYSVIFISQFPISTNTISKMLI